MCSPDIEQLIDMYAPIDNRQLTYQNQLSSVCKRSEAIQMRNMRKRKRSAPAKRLPPQKVLGPLQENHAVRRPRKVKKLLRDTGTDKKNREAVSVRRKQPPRAAAKRQSAKRIFNDDPCPVKADSKKEEEDSKKEEEDSKEEEEDSKEEEKTSVEASRSVKKPSTGLPMTLKKKKPVSSQPSKRVEEIIKQVTYIETWYGIRPLSPNPTKKQQQGQRLELPLVILANAATHIKLPTDKWSSKVTLYKVDPIELERDTMTVYTGDLKGYKIDERERHMYQPCCVIFRRELPAEKCDKGYMPYDRAIIFKQTQIALSLDGKLINLTGAPDTINSVEEVSTLIDILEHITLNHSLVEIVSPK